MDDLYFNFETENNNESKTYVLIDALNLFYKNIYVSKSVTIDLRAGLSLNIFFHSLNFLEKKFNPTHYIICLDSNSWRKKIYKNYKLSRKQKFLSMNAKQKEEFEYLQACFNDLIDFLDKKTNITVLKCVDLEADDLISFWIQKNKNSKNIICSTDSDFIQLLKFDNVVLANTTKNLYMTNKGIFDDKNKKKYFKIDPYGKIKIIEKNSDYVLDNKWYELCLFLKIIRGDISDGILSIAPKIKTKMLLSAFKDRENKGFDWKNLMYQETENYEGKKGKIIEFFKQNEQLIDLTKQPDEIIKKGFDYLDTIKPKNNKQIGFYFLKFCNKYGLERIERDSTQYLKILSKKY